MTPHEAGPLEPHPRRTARQCPPFSICCERWVPGLPQLEAQSPRARVLLLGILSVQHVCPQLLPSQGRLPLCAPPLSADPCLFPVCSCRAGSFWKHFCTYGGGWGQGKKSSPSGKYPGVGLLLGHRVNCFRSKNIGVWGVPRRSAVNTSSSVRAALLRYPQLKENIIPGSRGWDQVGTELRFLRSLSPGPLRPSGGSTPL